MTVERDWFWFWFWFYYALWLASVLTLVLVLRQSSENRSIYADVALVLVSLLSTIFQCKDLNVSKTKKRTKIFCFLRNLIRIQCEEKILLNGLHDICSSGSLPFFMTFYQVLTPLITVSLQCTLSSDRFSQLVYKL